MPRALEKGEFGGALAIYDEALVHARETPTAPSSTDLRLPAAAAPASARRTTSSSS